MFECAIIGVFVFVCVCVLGLDGWVAACAPAFTLACLFACAYACLCMFGACYVSYMRLDGRAGSVFALRRMRICDVSGRTRVCVRLRFVAFVCVCCLRLRFFGC